MRARLRRALILATAFGVGTAGCVRAPSLLAARLPCNPSALLRDSNRLAALPAERAEAEFAEAKKAFEKTGDDCDRFRVALVAVASPARRHDAYGARLMEEYLEANPSKGSSSSGLARLLLKALQDGLDADARLRASGRRLSEEQARADALRRQLDELKNIEKILKEREKQ